MGRTVPKPHVAPANLTAAPVAPPTAQPIVVSQALLRPLVARTTPKPHIAGPNLAAQPFPPGTFTGQALLRTLQGRTVPKSHTAKPSLTVPATNFLVPAYFYPFPAGSGWTTITSVTPSTQGWLIANPASGPGTSVDSDYTLAITAAQATGWKIAGYVDTDYAIRGSGLVDTDISNWQSLYGITSIFFDRADNTVPNLGYYQGLAATVHGNGGIDILNFGTAPASQYLSNTYCDVAVVFEGPLSTFQSSPPANYTGSAVGIAMFVYGVVSANANATITTAKSLGATWLEVTDETDDNFGWPPGYAYAENQDLAAPFQIYGPWAPSVIVSQAGRRATQPRPAPRPHLAAPLVAPGGPQLVTRIEPTVLDWQALRRPLVGRSTPRPHLAPANPTQPVPTTPVPPAVIVSQARQRPLVGRTVPRAHVAPANLTPAPFAPALITSQTLLRPLVGRSTPKPHLATANLTAAVPTTPVGPATITGQALLRPATGRSTPRPHVAPTNLTAAPVPPVGPAIVVSQARTRPLVGRPAPLVLVAPALVAPGGPQLVTQLSAVYAQQAFQRPARTVPKAHLAVPVLNGPAPLQPAVIVGQAKQRPTLGRTIPRAHLAAANLTPPPPVGQTVTVTQVLLRPLVGRTIGRPHVAGPVLTAPPVVTAAQVTSQALLRTATGRTIFRPHLAPANLTQPIPQPPVGKIVALGQAIRRALVGRTIFRPHLAPRSGAPTVSFTVQVRGQQTTVAVGAQPTTVTVQPRVLVVKVGAVSQLYTSPSTVTQAQAMDKTWGVDCTDELSDAQTPTIVSVTLTTGKTTVTLTDAATVNGNVISQRIRPNVLRGGNTAGYQLTVLWTPSGTTDINCDVLQINCPF